jgi:hypothetical protein
MLLKKSQALLVLERNLTEDERKENEWLLTVTFKGIEMIVGKGDVNTMFYQLGEGKRAINYPDEVLTLLEKLAKRKYVLYRANDKLFVNVKRAFAFAKSGRIYGILEDGKEKAAYKCKPTLKGGLEWEKI